MSWESSYKGPFECDEDVEESPSSSVNSDEQLTEFIESCEIDPLLDVESQISSSSLKPLYVFPTPLPSILLNLISEKRFDFV